MVSSTRKFMPAAIGRRQAWLGTTWFVVFSICLGAVVIRPSSVMARPYSAHLLGLSMRGTSDSTTMGGGGEPLGNEFRISVTVDLPDGEPSVVFNNVRGEYLVVWSTLNSGRYRINAQRVAMTGYLVGGPIAVAGSAEADRTEPDVAYSALLDRYLVVWQQNDGLRSRIFGRFLSGVGIGLGEELAISSGTALKDCHAPAVAYGQSSDRYVVVWDRMISGGLSSDIEAQLYSGSSGAPEGNNYLLKAGTAPIGYYRPDLAYNEERDEFLLVWEQLLRSGSGNITDIYAHLLQGTGVAVGGDDIEIARLTSSNFRPAVAAMPFAGVGQYLVTWELAYTPTDRDIFARIVAGDGVADPTLIDVSRAASMNRCRLSPPAVIDWPILSPGRLRPIRL